ncbi:unnamed protein product [Triticum turgidum subsp. durum]|uniref:Disease resistance N-terminal domain-containing protein n=1 Tax=Triticum turgidum subsp. durum TaxID=4567 RepID=A0A9R1NGI2_TRITD|nr:unnamed protein product [Triticum turgidum subsp. durum]
MEAAISVVTAELVSRFISFLKNKYQSSLNHAESDEKVVERLQHLLTRVSIVVEEADGWYITNSGMLLQLKMLSEAMYKGYRVLDTLRYKTLQDSACFDKVSINDSSSSSLYLAIPFKRSRTYREKDDKAMCLESDGVMESLETIVAHMAEFVVLLGGYNLTTILDHGRTMFGMTLVVIEFASDVDDDDWKRFHSFLIRVSRGSKIIIISKLTRLARFESVQPIFQSVLSYDELRYLFKTLAFGSVDPIEHPQLVQIADGFAKELHTMQGALVATNMYADDLRRNLDVQSWRCILDRGIRYVKRNISIYGVHPSTLLEQGHLVDITDFALHPLSMRRYTINASIKEESPSVTLGELLADPSVRPNEDFILISWESRIPPRNTFARIVTSHAEDTSEGSALHPGRKRRGAPI